jgi:hypothetical protein
MSPINPALGQDARLIPAQCVKPVPEGLRTGRFLLRWWWFGSCDWGVLELANIDDEMFEYSSLLVEFRDNLIRRGWWRGIKRGSRDFSGPERDERRGLHLSVAVVAVWT